MRGYPIRLSIPFLGFGLFLLVYQRAFSLDFSVVIFGLLSLLAASAAAALAAFSLGRGWPMAQDRTCVRILAAGLALVLTAFAKLYLLASVSNALWGDTLDYRMVATFAPQLSTVFGFGLLSGGEKRMLQLSVAGAAIVFVAVVTWLSWRLATGAVGSARGWLAGRPGRQPAALAWSMAAVLAGAIVGCAIVENQTSIAGEPLTSFLGITGATSPLKLNARRIAALEADQASLAAYAKGASFEKRNVIVIFADSLRADHMGVYAYPRQTTPFLSSLQARGELHRVETALSTCSESFCGIASTLASKPFSELSIGSLKLTTILRRQGYRIHFYLSGNHRSWRYLSDFYGEDVDDLHEFSERGAGVSDDTNLIDSLEKLPPDAAGPDFFYFFLMSSHIAGTRFEKYEHFLPATMPEGGMAGVVERLWGGRKTVSDELRNALVNRYDNGVLQADDFIRQIARLLDDKGYLKNSLVVILGDHGDGLGEHGNFLHTAFLYQEHIRIPLLIWDPELDRYRNDAFATQIDVAPTILDRLGLPVPPSWRGVSLLDPPGERLTFHESQRRRNPCVAIIRHHGAESALHPLKYIRCGSRPEAMTEEVFDLAEDPQEQNNLVGSIDRDALQAFRAAVAAGTQ